MSEQVAEQSTPTNETATPSPEESQHQEQPQEGKPKAETFSADYVEKLRKEAATYRTKAQENASAAKRLAEIEEQSKTETERLLDGARKETAEQVRAEIVGTFGQRLARQSFRAAAAQRNPEFDAVAVLDDINLARYVGDDGEPDEDAIRAAVERLVPQGGRVRGDVGQGVRNTAPVEVRPGMDRMRYAYDQARKN